MSRMLGFSCWILDRSRLVCHFAIFSSFVVSFYVVCLHLHVLLAGAFVASLGVFFPGLLSSAWLWFSWFRWVVL